MNILLLHGPNLNLLGTRQTEIYGVANENDILRLLKSKFPQINFTLLQSNSESELINQIQLSYSFFSGIVFNAGGFSHTSVALADAIKSVITPVFSVHISNIYNREIFRQKDLIGECCKGSIVGLGIEGYVLATECLLDEIYQL